MRNTLALLLTGCALLGTVAAQAQFLPISNVTPSPFTFTPGVGGVFVFNGTVTNNTATTIGGAISSLTLTPLPMDVIGDTTNFDLSFGLPPLAPGGTYMGELFTLNVGTGQLDPFNIRFDIQGLNLAGAIVPGATGTFPSAVPEPGSMALLAGGLISGGILALRRRRK